MYMIRASSSTATLYARQSMADPDYFYWVGDIKVASRFPTRQSAEETISNDLPQHMKENAVVVTNPG